VQNAETAAWGRAIVAALAADTKRGIASAEEVRNGSANTSPPDPLIQAKVAVADAWNATHEGTFDRDAMAAEFEQWAARPLADATPQDLLDFARDLTRDLRAKGWQERPQPDPPTDPGVFASDQSPTDVPLTKAAANRQPVPGGGGITKGQLTTLSIDLTNLGYDHDAALEWLATTVGQRFESRKELSYDQAKFAIDKAKQLVRMKGAPDEVH
jgi:hypothetical protein